MSEPKRHRCAAGRACKDPVIDKGPDGDTREPAVIEVQRGLCRRCTSAVNAAVVAIREDYGALAAAVDMKRTAPRDYVSGTPEPPLPINTTTDALARTLAEWADAALGAVAGALGIDHPVAYAGRGHPTARRNDSVITHAMRVVVPNVDKLLDAPPEPVVIWDRGGESWHVSEADGIDIALQLVRSHRNVAALLGDGDGRERLAMPCPVLDCGAPTLGRSNGSTDVTCTSCGGRWSEREYAWLAGLLIADIKRGIPAVDVMALVSKIVE